MYKYINLNGQYGIGQGYSMSYATAQEVMDHMDRLGIWQTVVEYAAGNNCLYKNQILLEDIQKIPDWKSRIIPSFQMDVSAVIQNGAMEQIAEMLETYHPSCVTLQPKRSKYPLRLADMALEYVKHLDPVVLIDKSQLTGDSAADDLVYLAQRYPNMRFVIRRVARGHYSFMFDVMRRAENIYVDCSTLYTKGALEIFCKFFGAHRVLFSTDIKSNHGAAMAAIAWADLPEQTKDQLRFGNFIALFGSREDREKLESNLKAIPNRVQNRFWTPFLENRQAPDVEIYDIHTHMGSTGGDWYLREQTFPEQIASFEKDMERFHIRKLVSTAFEMPAFSANLQMEQACRGKEDRFKGYIRYNPRYGEMFTEEFLDGCMRRGYFVGLKTLPSYMATDIRDESYEPMFRYAHKHGLPVLIHTWDDAFGQPAFCAEMAEKWPNAKIILGHTGGPDKGRLQCEKIAQDPRYSNVYFEFCGSFTSDRSWEETLQNIDYRRVLYGTDACLHDMAWELGRLLSADIPDDQLTAILGQNAKRLFGF